MNHKRILFTIGQVIMVEAVFLALPLLVAVIYGEEKGIFSFLIPTVGALVLGGVLAFCFKNASFELRSGDGMAIVSGAWLGMSLIGAVPFVLAIDSCSYVDAFFETVSGFTTTGASVLPHVSTLPKCILFWRSFTHWIGGMGVLVFVLSIAERSFGKSIHILRAEMAGPDVDKVAPTARATTKLLYYLYISLTVAEIVALLLCKMPLFDSVCHALATAGTGGFGIRGDSIESYNAAAQIVITIFMWLFGVSFNVYFLLLAKRWKDLKKQDELWCYVGITLLAAVLLTVSVAPLSGTVGEAIRAAFFATTSMITTTGFATADYAAWPEFSRAVLFFLMFCGGCIGSTAGGLKVGRILVLVRNAKNDLKRAVHPRTIKGISLNGKALDPATISGINTYFVLYMVIIFITFLLLALEPTRFETDISVAIACVGNIGPAFGEAGPMAGYDIYSDFATVVLSFAMLLGRLEIYPLLACLMLGSHKKSSV